MKIRWVLVAVLAVFGIGACQPLGFAPPSLETLPNDERGAQIRYGYQLVANTQEHARGYVGNALNCANCHLDAGRRLHAAPYVGLMSVYPEYRPRNASVSTIEDRLDQCFERSLNGRALPPGSREKEAIVAYIAWLSEGVPVESARAWRGFLKLAPTRTPDPGAAARQLEHRHEDPRQASRCPLRRYIATQSCISAGSYLASSSFASSSG